VFQVLLEQDVENCAFEPIITRGQHPPYAQKGNFAHYGEAVRGITDAALATHAADTTAHSQLRARSFHLNRTGLSFIGRTRGAGCDINIVLFSCRDLRSSSNNALQITPLLRLCQAGVAGLRDSEYECCQIMVARAT
jgi:hypothetical protein